MKSIRSASASFTTVVSLGVLYVLVVIFAVVISKELILSPEEMQGGLFPLFVGLGILFPLVLMGFVLVNVLRLLREFRRGLPGSAFKGRLSLFFTVVVLLAAVPQGVVSVTFLSSALELVFSTGAADAIARGLDITLSYYDREVSDLERVARDGTLERILQGNPTPQGVDAALRERLYRPEAVQVFLRDGSERLFSGDPRFRQEEPLLADLLSGTRVTRLTVAQMPVLRLTAPVATVPPTIAMVTTRLPEGFEDTARALTEARSTVAWFEQLRPTFILTVGLVYGVFMAPILLLAVLISFFLSERIMQPIESLEEATNRVAQGDYSVRILARPNDDLGLLVISFNNMVNELDRARRRMMQAEKVQAWQEIAQRLAHEVKNPLTPIRLAAERLRRRYHSEAEDFPAVLDRTVETIVREVEELTTLLDEFRAFARMPQPMKEEVELRREIAAAAAVFAEDPRVTVDLGGIDPNFHAQVDRNGFRRILLNLITNAAEATTDAVCVRLYADVIRKNTERYCRLRLEDDGPGIPPELGQKIFDPYVTTKVSGTGLGLAIVERIVFDHGGTIVYESAPGSGTTFIIDLPLRSADGDSTDS